MSPRESGTAVSGIADPMHCVLANVLPQTTDIKYLALTFGTLLSSQGTDTSFRRLSHRPSGRFVRVSSLADPFRPGEPSEFHFCSPPRWGVAWRPALRYRIFRRSGNRGLQFARKSEPIRNQHVGRLEEIVRGSGLNCATWSREGRCGEAKPRATYQARIRRLGQH